MARLTAVFLLAFLAPALAQQQSSPDRRDDAINILRASC
jgi:hypothetical protein